MTRKGESLLGVLVCTGGTVCIICSVYSKRAKAYRLYVGWYVWDWGGPRGTLVGTARARVVLCASLYGRGGGSRVRE